MTNEEIKKKAALLVHSELVGCMAAEAALSEAIGPIEELAFALVSQAYEEAARAVCGVCATGNAPVYRGGGTWTHPGGPDCGAGGIHDLRAALVPQETASASR